MNTIRHSIDLILPHRARARVTTWVVGATQPERRRAERSLRRF